MSLHDDVRRATDRAPVAIPQGMFVRVIKPGVALNATKRKANAIMGGTSPKWSASTPRGDYLRTIALKGW